MTLLFQQATDDEIHGSPTEKIHYTWAIGKDFRCILFQLYVQYIIIDLI